MKAYRKKMIGMIMAALFCFSPVSVSAAETETPVTIASGLDLEAEEVECTFDDNRIVYGEAAPDTIITFTISKMDRHGELHEVYEEEFLVGSLGLFSATFPLEMGYNYITMTAEQDGLEDTTIETVVKRIPQKVKKQLQRMIALPGLSVTF